MMMCFRKIRQKSRCLINLLCLCSILSPFLALAVETKQENFPVVILPEASTWRYVNEDPGQGWMENNFDDKKWSEGDGNFGDGGTFAASVRTPWKSGQIWLRRTVKLTSVPANPQFALAHRGEFQVYLNGKLVADRTGNTPRFVPMPIQGEAQASLKLGDNEIAVHCTCIREDPLFSLRLEDAAPPGEVQAPLFRDPRYDGAADPVIVWNRQEKCWTMLYTQRRANLKYLPDVGYCYGCDIGMAISKDGGRTWAYDGEALGLEYKGGRNTFWAPEVFYANGIYHMFVSYIAGVHTHWEGQSKMIHYTSQDLKHWTFSDALPMIDIIDASIFPLPEGGWRLFFKQDSKTFSVDSQDLSTWSHPTAVVTEIPHEGPNVFHWKDHYWLMVDVWHGQKIYRSDDLKVWVAQEGDTILGKPGKRRDDGVFGRHADVLVQGERAFIIYFTHPGGDSNHGDATTLKRTSVQVAELEYRDGRIFCDRDKPLDYKWDPALLDW